MKENEICIVLINYNSLNDTFECVKSINESNIFPLPLIVVIDNASNPYIDLSTKLSFYKNIQIIKSGKNIGFGNANNVAINWIFKNVNCKYIFILNNDTVVEKSTLKKLRDSLSETNDNVVMAAPRIMIYSSREVWYNGGTINDRLMTPLIGINNKENDGKFYTDFASGCAMLFKADALNDLEGFDPFYFMYDEDVELCIRIKKAGFKILYEPASTVLHKCQGSQMDEVNAVTIPANQLDPRHPNLLFYLKNTIVNRRYTTNKHQKGLKRFKAQTSQFIYWSLKAVQFSLYGKFSATFATFRYLLTGFFKTQEKNIF